MEFFPAEVLSDQPNYIAHFVKNGLQYVEATTALLAFMPLNFTYRWDIPTAIFLCYQNLVFLISNHQAMGRNTSVSLGDHFENFVDSKVSAGRFKNASEVIRAGLRLLEEEEAKIAALQKGIKEGFKSGFVKGFNPKNHLVKLRSAKRKNG